MTVMWKEQDNELIKKFEFKDFSEAFAFMTRVAILAEKHNHHPWWSNVYNQVEIRLSTHDADNTVTKKDTDLAQAIDKLLA
ncbi:MAG: 4a-hydroxytetrahydrobiopterin dehydratase [Chitinophagales bacterium]|jgi:4a-hydroxytetrahydrobiopterin dehydratase|tara:strand:- start:323 stop:565 length:243 start_codon:yes stop_codon:yes gene_type:complete